MNGIDDGERDVIYKCFEVIGCFILEKDSKTYRSLKAANKRCDRLNEKSNSGHHFIVLAASGWHEPMEAEE